MSSRKDNQQQSSNLGKIVGGLLLGGAAAAATYFGGKYLSEQLQAEEEQRQRQQQPNCSHTSPCSNQEAKSENKVTDKVCSICTEVIKQSELITLPCIHQFHYDCLVCLLKAYQHQCPNCRYTLSDAEVRMYLECKNGQPNKGQE